MIERAAPEPLRGPDIGTIVTGGRRLRTQRRLTRLGTAVALVGVLAVSAPAVLDAFDTAAPKTDPIPPAASNGEEPFREVEPIPRRQVYVDRIVGEEDYLIGKKRIVAAGKVLGTPWSMVEYITNEDHTRREGPSHCVEFFLGDEGMLGGGGNCANPKHDDSVITLSGQYWADAPRIVAVIGSVEKPAVAARVELADGRARSLDIIRSQKDDSVGWYVFFPPPFEEGRVVALDTEGNVVGSRPICFPLDALTSEPRMKPMENGNASCSQ